MFNSSFVIAQIHGTTGNNESSTNNIVSINYTEVKSNVQYTISTNKYNGVSRVAFYDKNKSLIQVIYNTATFTTPANARYIRFSIHSSTTITQIDSDLKVQVEQNSTATAYEEYIEQKIHILNDNNVYEEFMKKHEEIYSTNEQAIGKWIDGKTLYRKVINIGELIPNSRTDYSTGISNVKIKKFEAYFEALDNVFKLNHVNNYNKSSNEHESIALYTTLNGTSIRVENANVSATNLNCWVILEYTKISD